MQLEFDFSQFEPAKPKSAPKILYIGSTEEIVQKELNSLLELVRTVDLSKAPPVEIVSKRKPTKKQIASAARKRTAAAKKRRKELVKTLRGYHPGITNGHPRWGDWAAMFDDWQIAVTQEQVREHILWELEYWQFISENEVQILKINNLTTK